MLRRALFSCAAIVSGCGGSSSGSGSSAAPIAGAPAAPSPTPSPSPAPSPVPAPPIPPAGPLALPLRRDAGVRVLVDQAGAPFMLHGDACWSICVQLTRPQVDAYLNDRQAKGFTALLFNLIESVNSSQSPRHRNAEGNDPFVTMTDFTTPNAPYWDLIDYIIAGARDRGMVCVVNPAYLGFSDDVWAAAVNAAPTSSLQTYGAWLATRYQGARFQNVIWCLGGDREPPNPAKQWNIVTGIRSVTPNAVVTSHGVRSGEGVGAFAAWGSLPGFNLSNTYTAEGTEAADARIEYVRSPVMPFINLEGEYDGEGGTQFDCRRQAYASYLSGACGHIFGNNPIWEFGGLQYSNGIGAAAALASGLNTAATQQMTHVRSLLVPYAWHLLQPRADASLLTSALGSGVARICPALAADGTFAMIWKPATVAMSINMAALAPTSVRARWFDPGNGTFRVVSGSPFANAGTRVFADPGLNSVNASDWILVLDQA